MRLSSIKIEDTICVNTVAYRDETEMITIPLNSKGDRRGKNLSLLTAYLWANESLTGLRVGLYRPQDVSRS